MAGGRCLCGKVRVVVACDLPAPNACHCRECRKMSGHYWASVDVPSDQVTVHGAQHVVWFQSSEKVRRGFCGICGTTLFWDPLLNDKIAVSMGIFDGATGVRLWGHIFVAEKGDYYDIADGLPQNPH